MSTAVLKALANPLRRQVWNEVSQLRFARAADLVDRLDTPANTLSFHLRVLADAGLIEEAPEKARDRRDRVWKPTRGALSLGSPENPVADEALGSAVLSGTVGDQLQLISRVAAWAPTYVSGEDPVERGTLAGYTLRLTRERFTDLLDRIDELIDQYRDDDVEAPEARSWQMSIIAASDEI